MPGSSIVACSLMPMPLRMIRSDPSLKAPEHVTTCAYARRREMSVSAGVTHDVRLRTDGAVHAGCA
jgi:hypothetical protein